MHWKIETESIELQAEERLIGSEAKEKPLLMWDRPPSPPCLPRSTDACPPPLHLRQYGSGGASLRLHNLPFHS